MPEEALSPPDACLSAESSTAVVSFSALAGRGDSGLAEPGFSRCLEGLACLSAASGDFAGGVRDLLCPFTDLGGGDDRRDGARLGECLAGECRRGGLRRGGGLLGGENLLGGDRRRLGDMPRRDWERRLGGERHLESGLASLLGAPKDRLRLLRLRPELRAGGLRRL